MHSEWYCVFFFFLFVCFFSNHLIWNKFGSDLNEIWPTSTHTGRVDRRSTSVILTVKTHSDLSDSPSKWTAATGDNGASNCSQVECGYLYANEVGSKNFISIDKSTHAFLEFPLLVFSVVKCLFFRCARIYWAHRNGRKMTGKYEVMIMEVLFCLKKWQEFKCRQEVSVTEYCFVPGHSGDTGRGGGTEANEENTHKKKNSP